MTCYHVETCEDGARWQRVGNPTPDEAVAFALFDREVVRETVGVRVLQGERQLAAYWPGRTA